MNKIIADIQPQQSRVVLLENDELKEVYISRKGYEPIVGNIYKGRVENVISGMQAAFVDIGQERNAFLYAGDILADKHDFEFEGQEQNVQEKLGNIPIKDLVKQGQEIMVQVVKETTGSKGARVTTNITLPGRYLVLMPTVSYVGVSRRIHQEQERARLKEIIESIRDPNKGYIVRTAAQNQSIETFQNEMQILEQRWHQIQTSFKQYKAPYLLHRESSLIMTTLRDLFNDETGAFIINDRFTYEQVRDTVAMTSPEKAKKVQYFDKGCDIFSYYQLNSKIDKLLDRKVWLDSGAYLVIDQTEALTVIDVNTGKHTGGHKFANTILETNIAAAKEIANQIRLRGIGGIIIIDFIDMEQDEDREKVLAVLTEAVKNDRIKTNILGFTGLGLLEMTRKKVRQNLFSIMQQHCPYCAGSGRILNVDSIVYKLKGELDRLVENTVSDSFLIKAHPEVTTAISEGDILSADMQKWQNRKLFIRSDAARHLEDVDIQILPEKDIKNRYPDAHRLF